MKTLFLGLVLIGITALQAQDDIYETGLESLLEISQDNANVVGLGQWVEKGTFKINYDVMNTWYDNILYHNKEVSQERIAEDGFIYAPESMGMTKHSFSFQYAPGERVTFMIRGNYTDNQMTMGMNGFGTSRDIIMNSSGWSDWTLMSNFTVLNIDKHMLLVNIGLSLPTGSISKGAVDEKGEFNRYPYIMQTGSGTLDPVFELVYMRSSGQHTFGAGMSANQRYYDNKYGYHLGNEMSAVIGYGLNITEWWGTTFRIDYHYKDNVLGADTTLGLMQSPIHRADMVRGHRVDASLGMIFFVLHGKMKGLAMKIDYRRPIEQNYIGFGMKNEYNWKLSLQWIIGQKQLAFFKK